MAEGRLIAIVAVGISATSLPQGLEAGIADALGGSVAVQGETPLPAKAYHSARRQHSAAELLYALRPVKPTEGLLLGVTEVDLYTPGFSFIFGQAAQGIEIAVISLCRLRPQFYGLPPDEATLSRRAVKEAVHETGHLLGLRHCPHSHCVMFFSNELSDTDRKEASFCPDCRSKLLVGTMGAERPA